MTWEAVAAALPKAVSIAFDGCHKVYVLMDEEQAARMTEYGYGKDNPDWHQRVDLLGQEKALETLQGWYAESCLLRFVQAVQTDHEDPNRGFDELIAQGDDEEDEDL